MKKFRVGGYVRDTLLGIEPKDCDYVVVGATPEQMIENGYVQVGADFPVFLKDGEEYALARTERKTKPGYHGFETNHDSSVTLEMDLMRRDLTINSMAMDDDGNIIDPYNGLQDLKNGILRHTSEAFKEDPVRVLRVARFSARYSNFIIALETLDLMREIVSSGELDSLVKERVYSEFKKAFSEKFCYRFISTLYEVGALEKIAPSIAKTFEDFDHFEFANSLSKFDKPEDKIAYFLIQTDPANREEAYQQLNIPNEIKVFVERNFFIMSFRDNSYSREQQVLDEIEVFHKFKVSHDLSIIDEIFTFWETLSDEFLPFRDMFMPRIEIFNSVKFNSEKHKGLKGIDIATAIDKERFDKLMEA